MLLELIAVDVIAICYLSGKFCRVGGYIVYGILGLLLGVWVFGFFVGTYVLCFGVV